MDIGREETEKNILFHYNFTKEEEQALQDYNEKLRTEREFNREIRKKGFLNKDDEKRRDSIFCQLSSHNGPVTQRASAKFFIHKILPYLIDNPGFLQATLKKLFPTHLRDAIYNELTIILYYLQKSKLIMREKQGISYKLYVNTDKKRVIEFVNKNYIEPPEEDFMDLFAKRQIESEILIDKQIEKIRKKSKYSKTDPDISETKWREEKKTHWISDIPVKVFPNSKVMIIEYFGKEIIEKLLSHYWEWVLSNDSYLKQIFPKDINNINDVFKHEDAVNILNSFLSDMGGCLKFEVDNVLQQIIDKYWTKECQNEFKKYLSKYGFFADEVFFRKRLKGIIGNKKYQDYIQELQQHALEFQIKCCRFNLDPIYTNNILWRYMQSLKFKWGIKPEILVKKCKYCGKNFIPVYDLREIVDKIAKSNAHMETINDINFCEAHALENLR